jgi:hypothetical protein
LDIFLSIIKGALDTEAPIKDYTQTSRQYLEPIHPSMARLVGGMGMWLYPDGAEQLICYLLSQIHTILPVSYKSTIKSPAKIKSTFQRMMSILNWQSWSVLCRGELIYTFIWILKRMWYWSSQLTPEYLHSCCATPDFFGNNSVECNQASSNHFLSNNCLFSLIVINLK